MQNFDYKLAIEEEQDNMIGSHWFSFIFITIPTTNSLSIFLHINTARHAPYITRHRRPPLLFFKMLSRHIIHTHTHIYHSKPKITFTTTLSSLFHTKIKRLSSKTSAHIDSFIQQQAIRSVGKKVKMGNLYWVGLEKRGHFIHQEWCIFKE